MELIMGAVASYSTLEAVIDQERAAIAQLDKETALVVSKIKGAPIKQLRALALRKIDLFHQTMAHLTRLEALDSKKIQLNCRQQFQNGDK
jgi:hypothetical protein